MWKSLSCLPALFQRFDKNNPEMGTDSVARQMHQKTVKHYWAILFLLAFIIGNISFGTLA